MSQAEKSAYYQALKASGEQFAKHYREYSVADLKARYNQLKEASVWVPPIQTTPHTPVEEQLRPEGNPDTVPAGGGMSAFPEQTMKARRTPPVAPRDPNELAGQRLNSKADDEPIRTDEDGKVWLQEEVLKPAYPKPRGRRVLKYMDPGVVEQTVKNGDYVETFEVSGDPANAKISEVKITLPSYQVGVYRDPRFPFKVITYNGNNGFDLGEVQDFYGGAELVPPGIKRMYVENVLCYDIRTTVRAINEEYRQQQLAGKIR